MSVHSYKSLVATLGREQSSLVEAIYASSNLSDEEKITLEARASNLERSFNFVLRKLALLPGSRPVHLKKLEDFIDELEWIIDNPDEPMVNAEELSAKTREKIEGITFSFNRE